jgi:hypothetical protein
LRIRRTGRMRRRRRRGRWCPRSPPSKPSQAPQQDAWRPGSPALLPRRVRRRRTRMRPATRGTPGVPPCCSFSLKRDAGVPLMAGLLPYYRLPSAVTAGGAPPLNGRTPDGSGPRSPKRLPKLTSSEGTEENSAHLQMLLGRLGQQPQDRQSDQERVRRRPSTQPERGVKRVLLRLRPLLPELEKRATALLNRRDRDRIQPLPADAFFSEKRGNGTASAENK